MGDIKQDGKSDFVIGDGDSKRAAVYVSVIELQTYNYSAQLQDNHQCLVALRIFMAWRKERNK